MENTGKTCYIYENHLGGMFVTDYQIDDDLLYCDQCGDSDWLLLASSDEDEIGHCLRDNAAIFGLGGYDLDHLNEIWEDCCKILFDTENDGGNDGEVV